MKRMSETISIRLAAVDDVQIIIDHRYNNTPHNPTGA